MSRIPFNALNRQHQGKLGEELRLIADRVINSGWYVLGKEVASFEREFANYCGVRHCVSVANGSEALQLAIACLDLPEGCEIAAAANAAMYGTLAILANDKRPRFVDVDGEMATLDSEALEAAISPATRAVVVTHLYGRLADMDAIHAIANRHGLRVVEDCAQAHGASRNGKRAGSFGDVGCFSFYPTKNLGALGDGGAVVTHDDALAERLRQLRQYGWQRKYDVRVPHGRNSRLDEMQAAFLVAKLPHLDDWNERRRAIAFRYSASITKPGIVVPHVPDAGYVAHLYVVQCQRRESLRSHLAASGIGTDVHYPIPDYRQAVFADRFAQVSLPITESLAATCLSLPCFPELEDGEVADVIAACNDWGG